jgi:hypothetical protein
MSGIQLMFLGGAGANTSSWIGLFGLNSASDRGQGCAIDSSGNMYVGGFRAALYWEIAKYNSSGTLQWQKTITSTGSGGTSQAQSLETDSSGNVYICGGLYTSTTPDFSLVKYDTNGTLLWQRRAIENASNSSSGWGVALNSAGSYISTVGYMKNVPCALQWDSSGSGVYSTYPDGSVTSGIWRSVAVDSSGNTYAFGYVYNGTYNVPFLIKYNSSFVSQSVRSYDIGSTGVGTGIVAAVSGSYYVCGYYTSGGNAFVAKLTSSGAVTWSRFLTGSSTQWNSIAVDASDNVYLCGQDATADLTHIQLAKYDSSGNIQWQRKISNSSAYSSTSYGQSIKVSAFGFMYVCGYSTQATTGDFFVAKLPTDGSKTGTYSIGGYSMTYASSSLTDSDGGLSAASGTNTQTTPSLTFTTTTDTFSNSSLTDAVTTL